MATPIFLPFSPTGALDTTNPISDRAPGTLIEAMNVATRWMGPRLGARAFAQSRNVSVPGHNPRPVEDLYRFTGGNEFITRQMTLQQQYLLPRSWTLDLVFAPEAVVGNGLTRIFDWSSSSGDNDISISRHTTSSGTPKVIQVDVATQGGVAGEHTLVGEIPVNTGTDIEAQAHVRVTRRGSDLRFFVNGQLDQQKTIPDNFHGAGAASWRLGDVAGAPRYTGLIHRAVLRQGGTESASEGYSDFMFPMAADVRLYVYGGRQIKSNGPGGTTYHTRDFSRFGSHGLLSGVPDVIPATSEPPFRQPVQLITTFTDQRSRRWNIFIVGGTLFWEEVT